MTQCQGPVVTRTSPAVTYEGHSQSLAAARLRPCFHPLLTTTRIGPVVERGEAEAGGPTAFRLRPDYLAANYFGRVYDTRGVQLEEVNLRVE
ncbi:hypothetical protein EVAR_40375_1 [Eumeta japonica]|uniref:Uncharacterized protein n=1 Tax=Eumeta variegata TaxID=151549 RepID=A0A4C1XNH4_EUMVA|nr:hypothetical protein EVAR_40375_1 [Eumeta japonica]